MSLERFFELQTRISILIRRHNKLGRKLKRAPKCSNKFIEDKDREYRQIWNTYLPRLREESYKLSAFVIRENLGHFGLEDMDVQAVLMGYSEKTPEEVKPWYSREDGGEAEPETVEIGRTEPMKLSDISTLGKYKLRKMCLLPWSKSEHQYTMIWKDGKEIGRLDDHGVFWFDQAPTLKLAISWLIATEIGSERIMDWFDINGAVEQLLAVLRSGDVSRDVFLNQFMAAQKSVFVTLKTVKLHDMWSYSALFVWQNATRELGHEHHGYTFFSEDTRK